ncbi:unnamed protein product [Mytilus coruscus]|uniref:Uncharacterized protein n=1 Tax=Mytilus coruscus TaxID=42192 RepID=A0A6J8E5K8_MYTCO|nr:unnamed protein product [Mytilus coruscus]
MADTVLSNGDVGFQMTPEDLLMYRLHIGALNNPCVNDSTNISSVQPTLVSNVENVSPSVTGDTNNEKEIYDGADEETEMFLCRVHGKPKRPCVFCGKFQTHLTRHLKTKHKGEEDVIIAMQLPPRDRNQAFDVLKRKGYHNYNLLKMKEDDFNEKKLIKERKPRKNRDGETEKRAMCSSCKGFFVKEHMKNHKVKCFAAEGCTRVPIAIPIETVKDVKYSEEYKEDILSSF